MQNNKYISQSFIIIVTSIFTAFVLPILLAMIFQRIGRITNPEYFQETYLHSLVPKLESHGKGTSTILTIIYSYFIYPIPFSLPLVVAVLLHRKLKSSQETNRIK